MKHTVAEPQTSTVAEIATDSCAPLRRKLLIIHGVGDFDEETITEEVAGFASKHGIHPSKVSAFNWDQEVGGPFGGFALHLGILAELCAGLLNLANLGFLQTSLPYCGIPKSYLRFQNWVFALGQIVLSFLIVLCVLAFLDSSFKQARVSELAVLITLSILLSVSILGAALSGSTQGWVVSLRRLIVTILWPVFHFLAAPVGFGLIAIAALAFNARISDSLEVQSGFLFALSYFGLRLATLALIIFASWIVILPIRFQLKATSDTARYIGLVEYRENLQVLLKQKLEEVTSNCDYLIILTHSLGSVIAIDCMLEHGSLFAKLKQLDFVTMGSPLRRLFHRFFPDIFAPVDTINEALRSSITGFAWVNVYRPLDFIGTRLGNSESQIEEFSTGQLLKNHPNYWRDSIVADLIAEGIQKAKHSAPNAPAPKFYNWPPDLCIDEYQGGIARLWTRRLYIFMGIFLGLITWQVMDTVRIGYPSFMRFFSPKMIVTVAKQDGWSSAIFQWLFLSALIIAGLVTLIRFLYKKVWWDWFGAYGSSVLGCVEQARRNALMRYAPKSKVL